jgi:hypothetical protein
MREWRLHHGPLPSSYDWSRAHAQRRGGAALRRLNSGEWPSASVVGHVFGSWQEARDAAWTEGRERSLARSGDASATTGSLIGSCVSTHDQCPSCRIRGTVELYGREQGVSLSDLLAELDREDLDRVLQAIGMIKRRQLAIRGSPEDLWIRASEPDA